MIHTFGEIRGFTLIIIRFTLSNLHHRCVRLMIIGITLNTKFYVVNLMKTFQDPKLNLKASSSMTLLHNFVLLNFCTFVTFLCTSNTQTSCNMKYWKVININLCYISFLNLHYSTHFDTSYCWIGCIKHTCKY